MSVSIVVPQLGESVLAKTEERDRGESKQHRTSPAVRRLLREYKLDVAKIQGTGTGGRISKKDIMQYIETSEKKGIIGVPEETKVPLASFEEVSPLCKSILFCSQRISFSECIN